MQNNIRCSIAMATYNGEKYIIEQLESILHQLSPKDEIIISDDGSTDQTIEIIKELKKTDKRIKLIYGPKKGVKQNFANAILNANGQYIFLCDQDDVWNKDKIEKILKVLSKQKKCVVLHNAEIVDENLRNVNKTFFEFRKTRLGIINNIIKNSYIGCCMAFTSDLKEKILPIPNDIEMHDQWIGIIGEKYGKSMLIDDCLVKYRRHENNVSSMHHYSVFKMLKNRVIFLKNFLKLNRGK